MKRLNFYKSSTINLWRELKKTMLVKLHKKPQMNGCRRGCASGDARGGGWG
jgi:hypothetical protein